MSYLTGPRMHFAGHFGADISTVNNYVRHFRDAHQPPDQGFNPGGSGAWSLSDCTITTVVYADGSIAQRASDDALVGMSLAQSGSACLVDLDPEQQMVSQIWGLQLQLGGPQPAFKGVFKTAAFSDLWPTRVQNSGGGDVNMTAFYHSILTGVTWNAVAGSRLADELKQASTSGLLSIKFNVDGFDNNAHTGRIVGTIGVAVSGEPAHFLIGRQCMPTVDGGPVWFFPAVVDAARGKLIADFGNALQTTSIGGPFAAADLEIGMLKAGQSFVSFGRVPIGPAGWYEQTAGICEFPADRNLTPAELDALGSTPIAVQQADAARTIVAAEAGDGLHIRAEDFVFRMSAQETSTTSLVVSRFGRPQPNTGVRLEFDPSGLQQGRTDPNVDSPASGLTFPATVTTDQQGWASVTLTANSIDAPRNYIDGQVYGVRYSVAGADPAAGSYFDPYDFLSVLVWTDYKIAGAPTWKQHVAPILGQYSNLYPIMKGIVDLGNYDSVVANKAGLQTVFSLPMENPHYMPVTRDLSPAKRQMILNWLMTTGNAGKPNLDGAAAAPPAPLVAAASPGVQDVELEDDVTALGGKTAALRRIHDRQKTS